MITSFISAHYTVDEGIDPPQLTWNAAVVAGTDEVAVPQLEPSGRPSRWGNNPDQSIMEKKVKARFKTAMRKRVYDKKKKEQ